MKQLTEFETALTRVMNHQPGYLTEEFAEYLLAAGFQQSESTKSYYDIMFYKDDRSILIKNDTIDFMIMTEEEPGERHACLSKYMSFSGFSQLDIFKFMMLLHVTGYVPLQQLIKESKKQNGLHPVFEGIVSRFGFADTKTELANY